MAGGQGWGELLVTAEFVTYAYIACSYKFNTHTHNACNSPKDTMLLHASRPLSMLVSLAITSSLLLPCPPQPPARRTTLTS